MWTDIASTVFVCVTMNHLGLIGKLEEIMGKLPVLNCPKCASFWFTLAYFIGEMGFSIIPQIPFVLAISFFAAYLAIWLELLEGYIDTLYTKLYDTLYSTTDTADTDALGAADTVPDVRKPSARRRHAETKRKNH